MTVLWPQRWVAAYVVTLPAPQVKVKVKVMTVLFTHPSNPGIAITSYL